MIFETFEARQKRADKKETRNNLGNLSARKTIPTNELKPKLPELDMVPVDIQEDQEMQSGTRKYTALEGGVDDSMEDFTDGIDVSFGTKTAQPEDFEVVPDTTSPEALLYQQTLAEEEMFARDSQEEIIPEDWKKPEHPLERVVKDKKQDKSKRNVTFHKTIQLAKHVDPEFSEKIDTTIGGYGSFKIKPGETVSQTWIENVFQKVRGYLKKKR